MKNLEEIVKPIIKVKVKTWDEVYFENSTKFSIDVLKKAKELWDESTIELTLPKNRVIEVSLCSNGQYYYNGYYISKSFATEILEEESVEKVGEFTQEQIQNYNNTLLKQLAKPHGRTHYYKFTLDFCPDYSIRFFLEFSDRKDYEGNWYLKSHKLKEYSLLSKDMAEDLIRKSCTTFVEEIIGRRSGKKYEKIAVSKDKLVKFIE